MQEQDIQAWERELSHTQMMQKQREGWELKEGWDGKRPLVATTQPKVFRAAVKTQWSSSNDK